MITTTPDELNECARITAPTKGMTKLAYLAQFGLFNASFTRRLRDKIHSPNAYTISKMLDMAIEINGGEPVRLKIDIEGSQPIYVTKEVE